MHRRQVVSDLKRPRERVEHPGDARRELLSRGPRQGGSRQQGEYRSEAPGRIVIGATSLYGGITSRRGALRGDVRELGGRHLAKGPDERDVTVVVEGVGLADGLRHVRSSRQQESGGEEAALRRLALGAFGSSQVVEEPRADGKDRRLVGAAEDVLELSCLGVPECQVVFEGLGKPEEVARESADQAFDVRPVTSPGEPLLLGP